MTVRLNHDEEHDTYELGDDVEGVFIAVASIPGAQVRGHIASVLQARDAGQPATPSAATAPDESGDYVDNGDGTYTRSSDGATGHFTPAGFTPNASS